MVELLLVVALAASAPVPQEIVIVSRDPPHAGQRFVGVAIVRPQSRPGCIGTIGSRHIAVRVVELPGVALCEWEPPRDSAGRTFVAGRYRWRIAPTTDYEPYPAPPAFVISRAAPRVGQPFVALVSVLNEQWDSFRAECVASIGDQPFPGEPLYVPAGAASPSAVVCRWRRIPRSARGKVLWVRLNTWSWRGNTGRHTDGIPLRWRIRG